MGAVTAPNDPLRLSLGAYLLGALDPAERAAVETHLGGCAPCREELSGLAGLPGLLGRLTTEEAVAAGALPGAPVDPGQQVLQRALTAVARQRHRQRRRGLSAAAAAVLIAAGGAAAAGMVLTTNGDRTVAPAGRTISAIDPGTHVQATATLRGGPAGTAIALRLADVTPGLQCRLVAVATDGRREVAGSWRVAYQGQADVDASTAIPAEELATLQVVTTGGTRLVTLPAHG